MDEGTDDTGAAFGSQPVHDSGVHDRPGAVKAWVDKYLPNG